jgi:tetratricopeptide (TPR) repeat protein
VGAGEDTPAVRLTWAASLAAADQTAKALGVLRTGPRHPELDAARNRVTTLPADAPGGVWANAIAPRTAAPLLEAYTRPGLLSRFVREGIETEEAIFRASGKSKADRLRWCQALLRARRFAEAERIAAPLREEFPDDDAVCLAYADSLRGLKLPRKAGLEYIPVVQRNHQSLPALLGVGEISLDAEIIPVAVDAFQKATALAPNSADAWIGLGKAHLQQRISNAKAIEAFEKAARLAPERTDYFVAYTNALRMVFRWKNAETLLRRRLAADPEDAEAYHFLAVTLLDGNRTPATTREAEALLKKSLELEPDAVTTMTKLGLLLASQDRAKEAIPLLETVIGRNRFDLSVTQALSLAYRQTGQKERAAEARRSVAELSAYLSRRSYLNDRLRVDPTRISLHRELAALLTEGGEDETARRHLQMADQLEWDPERAKRDIFMLSKSVGRPLAKEEKRPAQTAAKAEEL